MENESLNDTHESEERLDTSRSSTSEEVTSPRPKVPYALHIDVNNKENEKGESKPTTPNSRSGQSKNVTKKPQTPTETSTHTLRAPYAQPVLDASKLQNSESRKSSIGERLASAKERRIQQQKQLVSGMAEEDEAELDLKSRREKEDFAHSKWIQSLEDKRKKIEENKMKDDAHRKEVEQRKKQQLEVEKKKAEAKIVRTEQVYEVTMRQKRSTSSDRTKRWSWGAGADNEEPKSSSQINLSSPSVSKESSSRFLKSPLMMNSTHMTFASGLRSYESGVGRGGSPGRPTSSPGLTEPITISPRLLAPTRSSLARSRNAVNDADETASQSSNDSKSHGPMRSRSKDRRTKDLAAGRPNSAGSSPRVDGARSPAVGGKNTPERKSTPTRGSSPLVPSRRAPSPASLSAPTASSEARKAATLKSATSEANKAPKRGNSPQPRPPRAPSPVNKPKDTSHATPPRTASKRAPSPARSKPKVQNDSPKPVSTPPNIKPMLRPASVTQMKTKSSPVTAKTAKSTKPATTKAKTDAPKQRKKPKENVNKVEKIPEKSDADSGFEDTSKRDRNVPPASITGTTLSASTSGVIPKSLSDTSQGVSEIPPSEGEEKDPQAKDIDTDSLNQEEVVKKPDSPQEDSPSVKEDDTRDSITNQEEDSTPQQDEESTIKQDISPEDSNYDSPQMLGEEISIKEPETASGDGEEPAPPGQDSLEASEIKEEEKGDSGEGTTEIQLAAQSGFHLEEEEEEEAVDVNQENQNSLLDSFQSVEPVDPQAVSPPDSLEAPEQDRPESNLEDELEDASVEYPPPDNFDSESDEEEQSSVKEDNEETCEETVELPQITETPIKIEEFIEEDPKVVETVQKEDEEPMEKGPEVESPVQEPSTQTEESIVQDSVEVNDTGKEISSTEAPTEENRMSSNEPQQTTQKETTPSNEAEPSAEKKTQPRKNLESEEDLEAYRRTIAEKRRELKEKKEQEERERQERIRLAKIEQAKREEEARRMVEEAAAEAERERQLEEERARLREEEEKRRLEEEKQKEEEANARKREAAEKMKKEREMQKQKQEEERMARKKRLEMIMRRTRKPDGADPSKLGLDGPQSPVGTPSPQHTPIDLSPTSGRSPQTESPVGGKSPFSVMTPERSVSPSMAAIINKSADNYAIPSHGLEDTKTTFQHVDENEPNLLNFSNSSSKFDPTGVELIKIDSSVDGGTMNIEKPVPFEAFQQKTIINGVQESAENHSSNGTDPFNLFSNESGDGQQSNIPVNGNDDLLSRNIEVMQPPVPTEI